MFIASFVRVQDRLIYLATISVFFMPYLLPKMHERYFYPTDILSINPFFSLLKENHFMSLRIEPRVAPLTNAFEVVA